MCRYCRGALSVALRAEWDVSTARGDLHNPGLTAFIDWLREKCFPSYDEAKVVYRRQTGRSV